MGELKFSGKQLTELRKLRRSFQHVKSETDSGPIYASIYSSRLFEGVIKDNEAEWARMRQCRDEDPAFTGDS